MSMAMMHAAQGEKGSALETLDRAIASLPDKRSGGAVVFKARQLRHRINRKMKEGVPWQDWQAASFVSQDMFIRKEFERERDDGRWRDAAAGYEALAGDFSDNGRKMEAGLALNELGSVYRDLGDYARAEIAIRKALTLFEQIALPAGLAASWHKLGNLLKKQNSWEPAAEAYRKSLELKRECCDDEGEVIGQDRLFDVLVKIGRFEEAERAVSRSWEIVSEIGSARQKWPPLVRLLWLKVHQNDLLGAKAIAVALIEAVRGNRELETAASELRAMTEAGNWDGVKARLARAGITGPAEIPAPEPAVQEPRKASAASNSLRRRGQGWDICFNEDGPFQLKDTVGVQYLATLLGTPGEFIHCSRLASSKGRAAVGSSLTAENTPVLTPDAKRAYHVKLAELKEQIATAESRGLVDEVVDLKEEADKIDAALRAAHDKLGEDQSLSDDGNKIRNAVCNPIRRVMTSLRDDPQTREIGLHLLDQVSLGFNCVYPKNMEKGFQWAVEQ